MWKVTLRRFSNIVPQKDSGGWLKAAKAKFFGRSTVYRMLLTGSIASTLAIWYLSNPKPSEFTQGKKYIQPAEVLELGINFDYHECYLVGIIKPGSLKIERNTKKHDFVITDFIHEIQVHYEGGLPTSVKEGETVRLQGEFVDEYNPVNMIARVVQGAHESERTKVSYQARSQDIQIKSKPMN